MIGKVGPNQAGVKGLLRFGNQRSLMHVLVYAIQDAEIVGTGGTKDYPIGLLKGIYHGCYHRHPLIGHQSLCDFNHIIGDHLKHLLLLSPSIL